MMGGGKKVRKIISFQEVGIATPLLACGSQLRCLLFNVFGKGGNKVSKEISPVWLCCALWLLVSAAQVSIWPALRRARVQPSDVFNLPCLRWNHVSRLEYTPCYLLCLGGKLWVSVYSFIARFLLLNLWCRSLRDIDWSWFLLHACCFVCQCCRREAGQYWSAAGCWDSNGRKRL